MKQFSTTNKKNVLSIKVFLFFFSLLLVSPLLNYSQGVPIPNEAEWNGFGYSLKKVTSNTSIASGVNFSYTIMFTAPAGATNITIQDMIPPALEVVTVTATAPVNGVTPSWSLTGTPLVNEVVTYTLSGLPSGVASSGSFTIVVKFPEGITCNGASARNRAGILIDDKWNYTPYVSTTATADDPWRVTKSILDGPSVNPSGGACGYIIEPDDTVTYRLSVLKSSPYYGNVVGQQNMTSAVVTDVLPPGAVVLSSTCGIAPGSTGTITWMPNSGNLNAATPYAYYWCDITVYYPSSSFPMGSFIYNQVDLDGIMCNQQVSHTSNETCIEVGEVVANPSGYFKKYINLTNRVPGCTGYYTIIFCNNGNVPLSSFNIDDVFPSGISVDKIAVYGGNPTTTMDLTANSGANTLATGINSSYYNSGVIGYPVNDVQLQMTGSLPVGDCIYLYVYFTVEPNPTGTIVTNCATFDGLSNGLTLGSACVSFTVDEGEPQPCVLKDICSPMASYEPGDIIRFRLRVQNIGSADISGASFQDNLHSNFTYVGNETYYVANTYNPPCSSGGAIPSGTSPWTGVSTSHSGNNLSWGLPDIDSDCQLFYVGYCGYYGTWGLPYYFIEFDVMVDSTALPGVTPNNYEISGGNLTSSKTSNTVNVLVVASFGQQVKKNVSTDGGSTFGSSGTINPGGTARYQLNYKNTSNVPVTSVRLVDLLPRNDNPNDWLVLNRSVSRGSQFDVTYNLNHSTALTPSGTIPVPSLSYAPGLNICLPPFGINSGCTPTSWGPSPDQNVGVDYGAFILNPAVIISEEFDVLIPSTASQQQTVCNDFAAVSTASFLLDGVAQSVALTPIAAPPVCLTVDTTAISTSCCDSLIIEQVSDPAGADDCCFRISTDCEVKSINVSVNNGTLNSAYWNCGNLSPGYVGQSSYTFAANNCVVDMITCIEAGSGPVSVNVVVDFINGERCEQTIDLDCGSQSDCCETTKVEMVQDPDLQDECCARIVTECEVDSIAVSISNGTFGSASWNCGTVPTGYMGQSNFTFDANLCAVDLITCVDADSTGLVTIDYVVYFQNGEVCEKRIQFDCHAKEECCEKVKVEMVQDPDLQDECCARIVTECEVDSIAVNISNGTFGSASWNCGTVPTGYMGQSNFTFDANLCAVDLITCVDADSTGLVTIDYVVYFQNGEVCEKRIQFDCHAKEECCEKVKVEMVQDPTTVDECCARIVTECEVDSIAVSISNGTFGSASWNCGTVPTGYIGQSSFTFDANLCAVDLITCVDADSTGLVTIDYVVYFQNGEVCEKRIQFDCHAKEECCEKVKVEMVQDPTTVDECCARIVTECEVDSIAVSISNGTFGSASWNCGTVPTGYMGQSSFTFDANLCAVDLITCVDADSTGLVTIDYVVYFQNGEVCEKRVEIDCKGQEPTSACCPIVDFKLRRSWPFFNKFIGTFEIFNPDPSNPICSIQISSLPSGTFNTGNLIIDGTASGQSWTSTSIPSSGVLSPQAINELLFTLTAFNYKGEITICVIKCDGTECCYDFNWNGKPIVVSPWEPAQNDIGSKLVAVSVSPELDEFMEERIKYVSFGFANEDDLNGEFEFFAIGGTGDCDDNGSDPTPRVIDPDDDDDGISTATESFMSRHNAFFELNCPYIPGSGGQAPRFNLVLKGGLPKLGMALISEEGNVIFDGEIDLANPDSVISSVFIPGQSSGTMFEFINLYPNPSNGSFNVKYAIGSERDLEIRVVNALGKVVRVLAPENTQPGIHELNIKANNLPGGLYKIVLYSEGDLLSKSAIIKQ